MSDPAACCVLLCPSSEQSRSLRSVCFFDFPHPNDPRYPIWIERSLRAKDWTPSPTSKICSRHFRPSDILALPLADGSGRTEKRLKYDALPCVFEDLPQSMRPQTDVVPRADSPEIIDIPTSSKKRSADSLHEITCDEVKKETEDFVSASDAAAEVSTDVKSNFSQGDLKALWSDSTSARPTEPVNSSVVIPSAKKPKKDVMHEVTSDEVKRETDDSVIASDAVAEISTNVKSNFSHENLKALLSDSTSARATEPLSLSAAIPSAKIARQDPSPVVTDVLPNFSHPNLKELLNNPQNTNATGSVSSPVAIPSTAGLFPPVISSSNPIPMPSVCALAQKIVDGRLMVMQHCAQHIPPDFPAFTNADEARNCCVPGCRIDRNNNLQGRIRFEAFPTDLRLRAEWIKWVAFSGFWQPAPYSVVCSLHFLPSDYDYIGTVLCLKPTAIPVHTGCRNGLMRKLNGPCPFSRVCAICGCWRAIKQTIYHYKSASRLAFIPFPQEPNQRQKWLAACSEAPGENALYACERHFVPADIVTRFEQLGEMKFVLRRRNDILPCPSQLLCSLPVENQVRPPPVNLQINVSPRLFPLNTTNNSQVRSVANVFIEAVLQSPPSGTVPATPSSVLIRSAANSVSVGGATFMPSPNQTALPVVASPIVPPPTDQVKPGSSRNAQLEDAAASAKPPPHPVEEANIVCCVPGCQNVCQSKRQHIYLPGKPIFFPFVGVGDPRYRTWTQRLRYNSSWIPDSSERICSDHFNQSEIESSKSDASLVRKALPSQLSCMASLCGFTAADMATGAIGCAACGLRPPVDRQPKASEKLMFFRAPPSALDALWKKWVDFCNQRRNDIDWTLIGADTPWYLCENHFEGQYIEAAEGLGSIVSNSEAVPSWTYSLDVNYTDPKLATSTSYLYGHFLLRKGVFCCVPGCETILKKKDSVAGKFFEFIPPTDERYCDWLRMVRYNVSWVPERRARICLEHFPASAIKLKCRKKGSQKSACLLDSAFPTQLSCMESLCSFTPADLMAGKEGCAVCGLRPFASHRRLKTSEKLEFYRAPSGEMREKWIEFCKSQRNDIDWTSISEKTPWFLCENHFEAQKAVPSVPFSIYIKPRDLESAATAQGELAKMHERKRKKCAPVCCVPGCRKYAWNEIPSPPISFYHFHNGYIAKVNRSEWINRIRCSVLWTPKARDVVCSRHFSPEDFRRTTHDQPAKARCLRANVVPTQLDCVEEYRSPRNTHLAAGSGVRTCCVCGCWRPLDETELIPSERLNFFPFPDDDRLRHSWLTACRQWNTHLTVSKESLVCENHFSLDNLARLLAGGLLSKSDVIPTEKTFAKLPAPIRLKKISVEVGSCRITDRAPGYKCCVPGCGNRAHVEGRLEKITFHVFPRLGTSSRFCEWMNRIRCSISWRPHPLNRVCSKHFSPKDFVEETAKGRQPRTSLLKKDVMPSLLQCVEKFRCPMDLSEPADLNEVRMCCVCGWWRVVSERYVRSELLTFFPFPADDEQRTKWVDVCREWKPDFVFSEGLLVCENHFQLDDLTWVPVNRFNRELKLRNDAIPSERCLRLLSAVSDPHSSDDVTDGMTGVPVDGFGELSSCDRAVDDGESGADSDAGDYEERDIMPADESAWDFDALDDDDSLMEVDYPDAPVLHITEPLCAPLRITRAVENGLPEDEDFSNVSDAGVQDMALALPFTAEEPVKEAPPLSSPRCALDDALIYCDCCHKFLPTPCWLHAASVCDEPVVPLAVGSLPKMLYLDVCDDSLTGKAVFTKEVIARHTVFGPLIAPVAMGDSEKALYFCITDKPRKHYELESDYACNWMKHVRFADSLQNSNLLVFSRASQVVFVTIKTVAPHEELKVWYSKQYLEMLETPGHGAVEDVKLETKDEAGDEACVPLDDDNGQASEATPRDKNLIESTTVGTVSVSHLPMESESSLPVTVESDYRQTGENSRVRSKSKRTNKKRKFFTSNICSECNVRFRREDMLRLHQLGHTGYDDPPERECPECSKHFGDFPALLKHVDEHGTPLVQCPVCNETCSSSVVLLHLQRYHPGIERRKLYWERLNCDKCGLRFASNFLYRIHQLGHQDRECIDSIKITRKCPECGEMCESLEKLTEHVYAHGKLTKKCPVCNGYYPGLKKHIARCHPKYLARTRCSECGKEFGKAAALIKHMRAHRKKASLDSSTCQDCGLQFGKDSLFVLHKTSHGTTSYHAVFGTQKCPECDETFEETAELFQHIITHAVAAKKCPECGHWVGSLRMHLKRQHPGTPLLGHQLRYHTVTCLQCGLRFSTDLLRRIHECEHGGKELADDLRSRTACCECAEGFDSFDALVKHVKIHGRQTEECPVCKRRFSYLDNHIRHDHPGYQYKLIGRPEVQPDNDSDQRVKEVKYRNVTCNHCGLRFDSEAVCDLHRRQHADKGAMNDYRVDGDECPQCGESFQEFAALMAHVDSHGRRTDMCPVCGRWYAAVKQHIRRDHPDNYAESTAQENPGSDPPGTKEPDGYRCYKCGKMLPSRRSYDLHLKAHRIKEARFSSVTCNECGLRFISEVLCQLHKLRHDNDGCSNMELRNTKSCPECQEEFEEVELLADHVAAHGKATSKCPVCSCWFSQLRMHVQHEHPDSFRDYFVRRRRHSSAKDPDKTLVNESRRKQLPKRYSCTKCPKSFASIVHFQSHMKVNVSSAADNLTCDTCSLQFASQILCDLHKVTHGISADMDIVKICPECGEVFEQWEKLVEHVGTHGVKTAHINKISKCKICQQRFPSDCLLAQHAKEHENRESAQDAPSSSECVICRQRCADSSELQQHVKTHNGSRGFECPGCTATFPFYRLLSQHVTTHQHLPERKDFTCGICRATFSTDEDLQLHVFTHDAELTVKCHQCGEHFTDVADLYTHTALAHEASIVNGSDEEMNRKCWREIMSELPNEDAL